MVIIKYFGSQHTLIGEPGLCLTCQDYGPNILPVFSIKKEVELV